MDIVSLLFGQLLVWAFGIALLALVPLRTPAGAELVAAPVPRAWIFGCGWFAGAFVLTLWMRALSLAGIAFSVVAVGLPLLCVVLAAVWLTRRRTNAIQNFSVRTLAHDLTGAELRDWQRAAWIALLAWLALRYALLLAEDLWRPLYPWDAWTQWGTKARVWFELKTMTPFVPLAQWLQPGNVAYIDTAPQYPATVPLLQVWSALLLGRWDDALINLPWWLTAVAFAFALFGFLVQRGLPRLWALVVTWLVASLPILNAHVALAGYADLAMATYLTLGVLAAMQWLSSRQWRDAALAVLLLVACVTIKNPGKVWLAVLVPGAITALVPRYGLKLAAACIAGGILVLLLLAQTSPTILGYQLHLEFVSPWRGLAEALFAFGNWHLLWYGAIAVAIIARRQLFTPEMAPLTVVIGTGLLFLFFGFAFTNAARWVEDQSTVNRATLHLAPLVIVWMALLFRAWAAQNTAESPPSATIDMPVPAG
jgi:hypothetical protein